MASEYIKGNGVFADVAKKLEKFKDEFSKETLRRVQEYTPVDTGLLQQSWTVRVDESAGSMEFINPATNEHGVPYALIVELGTESMRGFFMAHQTIAEATEIAKVAKSRSGL
jgi:hypothetical protein